MDGWIDRFLIDIIYTLYTSNIYYTGQCATLSSTMCSVSCDEMPHDVCSESLQGTAFQYLKSI